MKYITKKAYINGLAARGCLRYLAMQKIAAGASTGASAASAAGTSTGASTEPKELTDEEFKKEDKKQDQRAWYLSQKLFHPESGYLTPGLGGAGIGAVIGALVQAARQKNILLGAGIGAGFGGLAGIGAKYFNDEYIYPQILENWKKSPVQSDIRSTARIPVDPMAEIPTTDNPAEPPKADDSLPAVPPL